MNENDMADAINAASNLCYKLSFNAGWWTDITTGELLGETKAERGMKIALIHSEISEALEGIRKDCQYDHIPHRKMEEVELADTLIRIFDYAGRYNIDLGGAMIEKLAYNQTRKDHKLESRQKAGGKQI